MTKPWMQDGVQVVWNSTSIELAATCLRKYQLRMFDELAPKGPLSADLLFGSLYASALEHFYIARAKGASIEDALILIIHEALCASWPESEAAPLPFAHATKTRVNLIRSIVAYIDKFGDESDSAIQTHHLADGSPAVELTFAFELADNIMFSGHLDRVVRFGEDLYWMDQKTTTSALGPAYFDNYKMSNQFKLYTLAGSLVLGTPVRGGIIDAARILAGETQFERAIISYTEDQIDEWLASASVIIEQAQTATRGGFFPQNLTACGRYNGCEFKEICAASPRVRQHIIDGSYVHSPARNPLGA